MDVEPKLRGKGRPKIGSPMSIAVTREQRMWLFARLGPGESMSALVRSIIQAAIEHERRVDAAATRAG